MINYMALQHKIGQPVRIKETGNLAIVKGILSGNRKYDHMVDDGKGGFITLSYDDLEAV